MEQMLYDAYVNILREELIPAMGCTEPIAIAYAAALARETLAQLPEKVDIQVSANIIKNVKSVVVPHTGGLRGIEAAAAAGIVAGDSKAELEVISHVSEAQISQIAQYMRTAQFHVEQSNSGYIFDIQITLIAGQEEAFVQIAGGHTNVIGLRLNDKVLIDKEYTQGCQVEHTDHSLLTVENIIDFADCVRIEDVKETLDRQIACNTAIAEEGLSGKWGANIGSVLLAAYGSDVHNRAKAWAAAGSDARMSGCENPVVINSGSGNQGITVSMPLLVYAREYKVDEDKMLRALALANLISLHQKRYIGSLSAYCGAVSAATASACGIAYMMGASYETLCGLITDSINTTGGMVCDGAKSSCASKIATAVGSALLSMEMSEKGRVFLPGEGLVENDVEETIANVGRMGREGMKSTDVEILKIMLGK